MTSPSRGWTPQHREAEPLDPPRTVDGELPDPIDWDPGQSHAEDWRPSDHSSSPTRLGHPLEPREAIGPD
jgi:hypothetical protein